MKTYKKAISIRGDMLYCPLCLSIDSYWACVDCLHCYMRRLNRTWGEEQRVADPDLIRKQLENGLKNPNPKTSLAHALKLKKTIRVGNKTDPYQNIELKENITHEILKTLIDLDWSFVIQTRFTLNSMLDEVLFEEAHKKKLLTIMPIISPGGDSDWDILEKGQTTAVSARLISIQHWLLRGFNIGVNGEPFIPGYHTEKQFEDICKRLKAIGVKSYNTYNLHMNDLVAKNLHSIGLDIEKIWTMNQDKYWKPLQARLCEIADKVGIRLGCPDFVNTPPSYTQKSNTCCGVSVPNPSKFNTHFWKKMIQKGKTSKEIVKSTWEGIGDLEEGKKIIQGKGNKFYTMKDAGLL